MFHFMERKKTKELNITERFKVTMNFQISKIYAFIASNYAQKGIKSFVYAFIITMMYYPLKKVLNDP